MTGKASPNTCLPMLSAPPYLTLSLRDRSPTTGPQWQSPPKQPTTPTLVPLLDLAVHLPNVVGMRPGLPPGRSLTAANPLAGRPPLLHRHSLPLPQNTSMSATPSRCSKISLTPCSYSDPASRDLAEALRQFPFVPGPPVLTPPTPCLRLPPPSPSISRTISPLPPLTPSPSPSPTPPLLAPSPCLPALTIWAEYLITHGGYDKNLLGPVRTVKKPRRYRLTPEQRRDEDKWMLTQIPAQGKRLTWSAYSKFLARGRPHRKATHTI
jgi:hypothetical protein